MPHPLGDPHALRRALLGLLIVSMPGRCVTLGDGNQAQAATPQTRHQCWDAEGLDRPRVTEEGMTTPAGALEEPAPGLRCNAEVVESWRHSEATRRWSLDVRTTLHVREQDAGRYPPRCCYAWTPDPAQPRVPDRPYQPICGRAFETGGEATVAALSHDGAWSGALPTPDHDALLTPDDTTRAEAARGWLHDALEEHASIAAFQRAGLELIARGAPPELLAGYAQATLDEIAHARACFGLAQALTGVATSAGALHVEGPRQDDAALILDTLWGGCVGESIAALCAARAAGLCGWPPAREALLRIAQEEAAHAALAWSTLIFLYRRTPQTVRDVLRDALPALPSPAEAIADPALNHLGRLTPSQEAAAARDALEHTILPLWHELMCATG